MKDGDQNYTIKVILAMKTYSQMFIGKCILCWYWDFPKDSNKMELKKFFHAFVYLWLIVFKVLAHKTTLCRVLKTLIILQQPMRSQSFVVLKASIATKGQGKEGK